MACTYLVPVFFICWLPLALAISAFNIRSSVAAFREFHGKPDAERMRLVTGELYPTIEKCLASVPAHERVLIVGFPYDGDFKLDYYLYPRRVYFMAKSPVDEAAARCAKEKIGYYVMYDDAGRPSVGRARL